MISRVASATTLALLVGAFTVPASAGADNNRLNEDVVAGVHNMMMLNRCADSYKVEPMARVSPKLQLAAQWHTLDVLGNRNLDGDIGSNGSTVADRARAAGYNGNVAETVAINPALAISGVEVMDQWANRPDYRAIMSSCANVDIGVWSENSLDRTVLVAVYGRGDATPYG